MTSGRDAVAGEAASLPTAGPRATRWRPGVLIASLVGLAVAVATVAIHDPKAIFTVVGRIGWLGFVVYCGFTALVFVVLAAAWLAVMGVGARRLGLLYASRMVREAVADLLPFSQIGGLVVGTALVARRGIARTTVYASLIADLTTENAAQLVFTIGALATAAVAPSFARDALPLEVALAVGVAAMAGVVATAALAPRWLRLASATIVRRMLPPGEAPIDDVATALAAIYRRRGPLALSFSLNLAGWILGAAGAWLALSWMGSPYPFVRVASLEACIFALRGAAFMVPLGIGVQEAGYASCAMLFGMSPEAMLALALVKRARDVALGLPTLLAWQAVETRVWWSRARGGTLAR